MSQEVIEITEREIEVIEVIERGPVGPTGPQANINYTVVSSAQTLSNSQNIAADTSGGSFTLTLPASPNAGDSIDIFDYSETFDTNPLTIARNGENIESLAEDLVCNVEGAYFTLIYTGATRGWQVLPRFGTSGGGGETVLTTEGDMLYRGAGINTRLPIGSAGQILKVNSGATAPEWGAAPATGVTSVGVSGSDGIEVDSGSPVTGSGTIALGVNAASLRSHINVADGAEVNVQSNWTEADSGSDAFILNKPSIPTASSATPQALGVAAAGSSNDFARADHVHAMPSAADVGAAPASGIDPTAISGTAVVDSDARLSDSRTPSAHSSTHHTGGTDQLLPQNIGAQSLFTTTGLTITSNTTLTAGRALIYSLSVTPNPVTADITLPSSGHLAGDIIVVRSNIFVSGSVLTIKTPLGATLDTINAAGQAFRYTAVTSGSPNAWTKIAVDTHTHPSTQITGLGTAATQDSTAFAPATGIDPTAITGTAVVDSDARLSDSRTPSSHASTHHAGGSDALAAYQINGQTIFSLTSATYNSDQTLSSSRARTLTITNTNASGINITLPTSADGTLLGDTYVIIGGVTVSGPIAVRRINVLSPLIYETLATITTTGEQYRFRASGGTTGGWSLVPVDSHTHPASDITSGTLTHERGGLEADVSAYDGLVKISGGSTSAVTVTTAGEALLDDADAAAQRTTLGLGNSATLDTGTTAGTVAAGDHTHELNALDATGATDGHVLTADGAGGAAFEALPASGIAETLLDAKGDLIVASAADTAARLAVGSNGTMLVADSGETTGVKWAAQPVEYVVACSDETTDLTTGTAKVTFRAPVAFLLTAVAASVNTAPTGSTLIVDINNGANSALSTKLSIDASEKTSATAATAAVIDTSYDDFSADAEITIDIDQIGSTIAGKGLKVILKGTRA